MAPTQMKAAWNDRYGPADLVQIRDVDMPEPGPGQVLVKVHSSSVTTADWRMRTSAFPGVFWLPARLMFGLFAPKNRVLGGDFAGRVVGVAKRSRGLPRATRCMGFQCLARTPNIW